MMEKLIAKGFEVKYTHPNLIFISWMHYVPSYVRNEFKKKTGIVIDEHGNRLEEYDEYGKQIYFINDRGQVIDRRPNRNINESYVNDKLIEKVFSILEPPLVQNLFSLGFDYKQTSKILSVLFKTEVEIEDDSVHHALSNTVTEPTVYYLFDMGDDGEDDFYYEYVTGEWDIHSDYKHFLSQLGKNNLNESIWYHDSVGGNQKIFYDKKMEKENIKLLIK